MSILKKEEVEYKDEFDFYNNPMAKGVLRELRAKVSLLPPDQQNYHDYAIHRKIKSDHGVVMPAYSRLLNAWKWMLKLEEKEPKESKKDDLPF